MSDDNRCMGLDPNNPTQTTELHGLHGSGGCAKCIEAGWKPPGEHHHQWSEYRPYGQSPYRSCVPCGAVEELDPPAPDWLVPAEAMQALREAVRVFEDPESVGNRWVQYVDAVDAVLLAATEVERP